MRNQITSHSISEQIYNHKELYKGIIFQAQLDKDKEFFESAIYIAIKEIIEE